jgi:HK97 gp10 family phage protein
MSFNVDILGAKELVKMLNELPLKIERNIMRAALRAGASVIAAEAKRNVPVDSAELKSTIRTSSSGKRGLVEANAVVGNKRTKKGWYATFVEFGTAPHIIKAGKNKTRLSFRTKDGVWISALSVNHTGATAKPFMRPAFDTKGEEAVKAVADKIRERLTNQNINKVAPENKV